mgnify:CR=1 FL=1
MHWISVALGGALGAVCRYWVSVSLLPVSGYKFPFATLSVNVIGSLLMGILYVLIVEKCGLPDQTRNILMVGFLGAFTTFSTFSLDAISLWQNGGQLMALIYVFATVALCLIAIIFAIWLLILMPSWLLQSWMHLKLTFVALLIVYHLKTHRISPPSDLEIILLRVSTCRESSQQRRVSRESDRRSISRVRCRERWMFASVRRAARLSVGGPLASETDRARTIVGAVAGGRLAALFIGTLRSVHFLSLFRLSGAATHLYRTRVRLSSDPTKSACFHPKKRRPRIQQCFLQSKLLIFRFCL